jgi:O-antigen/teichoic acid export membrane protein
MRRVRAPRPSLLFNSAVYVLGQVVSKALGFVLLLVYARFLEPADFGIIGTLAAYGALLSTLFVVGLHGSVSRHYFDYTRDPCSLRSYLTTVYAFQALISGGMAFALALAGGAAWRRFTSDSIPFDPFVQLMVWTTFLSALTSIPQAIYQTRERAGAVVALQLGQGALAVGVAVLFVVVLRQGVLGVLRTQAVSAAALALVFLVLFVRSEASRDLRPGHVAKALRFGLPLLPHALGSILLQTVDRIMLERYVPLSEVGHYSIAMTLGMILAMLAGGINQAWAPHFLRTTREEPEALARDKARTVAALLVALFASLSLIGGMLAPELARLVLGAKYLPAVPYLIPFVIGNLIAVCYYVPANQLFLVEKTAWFPVATGLATALSVGLNLWFLPRGGGGMAAAWIFVAGNVCQTGVILFAARRYQASLLGARSFMVLGLTVAALAATRVGLGLPVRVSLALALVAGIYLALVRESLGRFWPRLRAGMTELS